MSRVLSFTIMISDEITLNAATRMIMPRTMNMVFFCTWSTPMMVSLACRQSRSQHLAHRSSTCRMGGSSASTWSGSASGSRCR